MENIYLDAALLSVPNYAVDAAAAEELIDRVIHFSKVALPEVPANIVVDQYIEDLLWENNCGPDYRQIAEFIDVMGLREVFSAHDLVSQYHTILQSAARAYDVVPLGIHILSQFTSVPPLPAGLTPTFLENETRRIVATVSAASTVDSGWSVGSSLNGVGMTNCTATFLAEETYGPEQGRLGDLPVALSANIKLVTSLRDFANWEDARRIWCSAESDEDIHFAIAMGALSFLREAGRERPALPRKYSIGKYFLGSLKECQCANDGRFSLATHSLASAIAANLCAEIGTFGRPNQMVREIDGALAFRVHLTKAGAGLRLMFWDDGERIEFANIGVKHELLILGATKPSTQSEKIINFSYLC